MLQSYPQSSRAKDRARPEPGSVESGFVGSATGVVNPVGDGVKSTPVGAVNARNLSARTVLVGRRDGGVGTDTFAVGFVVQGGLEDFGDVVPETVDSYELAGGKALEVFNGAPKGALSEVDHLLNLVETDFDTSRVANEQSFFLARITASFGSLEGVPAHDTNDGELDPDGGGAVVGVGEKKIRDDTVARKDVGLGIHNPGKYPDAGTTFERPGGLETAEAGAEKGVEERKCFVVLERSVLASDDTENRLVGGADEGFVGRNVEVTSRESEFLTSYLGGEEGREFAFLNVPVETRETNGVFDVVDVADFDHVAKAVPSWFFDKESAFKIIWHEISPKKI